MQGHRDDCQQRIHWSEPRPSRRRQKDTADERLRSRSISTERKRPPLHYSYRTPTKQHEARDPPSVGRFTLDGARSYNSDDESVSRANSHRRVQFSRKLEISKTSPASSVSILRPTSRSQGVAEGRGLPSWSTPRAANTRRNNQAREPIGTTSRLAAADPPVYSPSVRSFSPSVAHLASPKNERRLPPTPSRASQSRNRSASPLRRSHQGRLGGLPPTPSRKALYNASGSGKQFLPLQPKSRGAESGVLDRVQSIERQATPTTKYGYGKKRIINGGSRRVGNDGMVSQQLPVQPTDRVTPVPTVEVRQSDLRTPEVSTEPKLVSSQDAWNMNKLFTEDRTDKATPKRTEQSKDIHTPQSPRNRSAIEILKDLWTTEPSSPHTENSTNSQSEYLINKYAHETKGRVHEILSPSSPVNDRMNHEQRPRSNQERAAAGRKGGRLKVSRTPVSPQIRIKGDEECPPFFATGESREHGGFGRFFKRRKNRKTSKTAFLQILNSVDSLNDSLEIVKKSTSETDELELEWNFDRRAAQWNDFGQNSVTSEESDNIYLIPNSKTEEKKKRCSPGMMLCLVLLCLMGAGLPIYFFIFADARHNQIDLVNKSSCVSATQATGSIAFSALQNTTFSERFINISELLADAVGNASINEVAGSAQRKALCWLSDYDERQLDIEQSNRQALIQRYTMAVLFFSLSDNGSTDPRSLREANFLSSASECNWRGTMCTNPGAVTALLLGDSVLQGQLPEEIGNLRNLSKLRVSGFVVAIPATHSLTHGLIAFLELSLNGLTGSIPTTIGMLTMLGENCGKRYLFVI